jgi:hypothetical protein
MSTTSAPDWSASGPPFVDGVTTWRVLSERVDKKIQVSILIAPGEQWAEYTFDADDATHRDCIAIAVNRHTHRTVTEVEFSHRVGDGCSCYIATVEPPPPPRGPSAPDTVAPA